MLQPVPPQLQSHSYSFTFYLLSHSYSFTFRETSYYQNHVSNPPIHFTSRQRRSQALTIVGCQGHLTSTRLGNVASASTEQLMYGKAHAEYSCGSHPHTHPPHPSHTAQRHGDLGQGGRKSQQKVPVRELQDMGKWKLYLEEENWILCPCVEKAERKTGSSPCVWIPITSATEFCKEPCLVGTGRAKSSSFYSNRYSNRLRAESSFWPLAI